MLTKVVSALMARVHLKKEAQIGSSGAALVERYRTRE